LPIGVRIAAAESFPIGVIGVAKPAGVGRIKAIPIPGIITPAGEPIAIPSAEISFAISTAFPSIVIPTVIAAIIPSVSAVFPTIAIIPVAALRVCLRIGGESNTHEHDKRGKEGFRNFPGLLYIHNSLLSAIRLPFSSFSHIDNSKRHATRKTAQPPGFQAILCFLSGFVALFGKAGNQMG
jgi:hypothetical protein